MKFRVLPDTGRGLTWRKITYPPGFVIEADVPLDEMFRNKVERLFDEVDHSVHPDGLGVRESTDEKDENMAHFIKVVQHCKPVPIGKGIVQQDVTIQEEGTVLFSGQVAFDSNTGEEIAPLPTTWNEVGKTITASVQWTRDDGTTSEVWSEEYVQEDNFTGPMPNPDDLGPTDQIDERESDERPTD